MPRASPADLETIAIFQEVAKKVRRVNRDVIVEFFPYNGVKSVARERPGYVKIRISDTLRGAPHEVLEALAYILLYRGKTLDISSYRKVYREYIYSEKMCQREKDVRKVRSRTKELHPKGEIYDLQERFDLVNKRYFGGELPQAKLTWSKEGSRRVWGTHDPALDLITLNKRMDSKKVPVFVIDYVLYHEMLHMRHEAQYSGSTRRIHHSDFKDEEEAFDRYKEACAWLQKMTR